MTTRVHPGEAKGGTDVTRLQTQHIAASSAALGWSGFGVELRRAQPPTSAQFTRGFRQVILALHLTPPGQIRLDDGGRNLASDVHVPSVTFIPAGLPCTLSWTQACDSIHLRFDPTYLDSIWAKIDGSAIDPSDLAPFAGATDDRLHRIGQDLLREVREPGMGDRLYAESLGLQAAVLLRRRFVRGPELALRGGVRQASAGIRRAKAFLREKLDQDIHLDDLARVAGMSPFHFAREFKCATGLPPHQYLMRLRVLRAEELLRRKGRSLSLAQVAAETGFFDQSHLTRHFRRVMGTTPAKLLK